MNPPAATWTWRQGMAYGLPGFALVFAELPLYVVLPNHYAREAGLPLATIGGVLLASRVLDALAEPLLGRLSDRLYARSLRAVLLAGLGLSLVQGVGMAALFFPLAQGRGAMALWLGVSLLVTCVAHSQLVIAHQAWGVRLGGDDLQRSRIVAWREALGLLGVIAASALSVAAGAPAMLTVFAVALVLGMAAWWHAPRPAQQAPRPAPSARIAAPLRVLEFRRLLAVFVCNGIAGAIPASLLLFFAQDALRASANQVAAFLVLYFAAGALSLPVWLRLVGRLGLARAWLAGMLLAIACFLWTAFLGAGDIAAFACICLLTGVALGADLALPPALLAGLVGRQDGLGPGEGAYLGWWNLATKLNLALAAGAALPLLQWAGYTPGTDDAAALRQLTLAYALAPCVLKLLAALLLHVLLIRPQLSWARLKSAT